MTIEALAAGFHSLVRCSIPFSRFRLRSSDSNLYLLYFPEREEDYGVKEVVGQEGVNSLILRSSIGSTSFRMK